MKVILFGASGMVGSGVLIECLEATDVESITVIGRSSCGIQDPKLKEILHDNFLDFSAIADQVTEWDACFYCLGISSAGMSEEDYHRITYEYTVSTAQFLQNINPSGTFCFVSGQGTDSTESGRTMWARIKGKAENALLKMGFGGAWMFRPGIIQPLKGVTSKTRSYQIVYKIVVPIFPILKVLFPRSITTTEMIGQAMLKAARFGCLKPVLESADIIEQSQRNA